MQFGVIKTPEYRKMNPNGLVPTIDDDGFVLWESHTIVRYLAAKHGAGTLWPTDLRARADAERWMDWAFTFQNAMRAVFWGLIRTPPEKRDLKAIEDGAQEDAPSCSTILERDLAGRRYVAGDGLHDGRHSDRLRGAALDAPADRAAAPAAPSQAWFERLCARPAFRKIVDIPLT